MPRMLLLVLALAAVAAVSADAVLEPSSFDRRKDKNPWFCHGKDCPKFETVRLPTCLKSLGTLQVDVGLT